MQEMCGVLITVKPRSDVSLCPQSLCCCVANVGLLINLRDVTTQPRLSSLQARTLTHLDLSPLAITIHYNEPDTTPASPGQRGNYQW